jgi:hypothetical protein
MASSSSWHTVFHVVAEHFPRPDGPAVLADALVVFAVDGDAGMVACESGRRGGAALWLAPESLAVMKDFHDLIVPRLRLVPPTLRVIEGGR